MCALDALMELSTARNALESPKSTAFLPNEMSDDVQVLVTDVTHFMITQTILVAKLKLSILWKFHLN